MSENRESLLKDFRTSRIAIITSVVLLWICVLVLAISIGVPFSGILSDLPGIAILGLIVLFFVVAFLYLHLRGVRAKLASLVPVTGAATGTGDSTVAQLLDFNAEFEAEETTASKLPLLGLVHAIQLSYQNHPGFGLAITPEKVVGAPLSVWSGLVVFLGPGSKADAQQKEKAEAVFSEIETKKNLELMKDDIVKISWKQEGFFDTGHFLIKTSQGEFELVTSSRQSNLGVVQVNKAMIPSLLLLAPDRFYNEKTGALIRDEAKVRYEHNYPGRA